MPEATRAEVIGSIESGYPELVAIAPASRVVAKGAVK
jgi:hypothetical protein